MKTVAEAEWSDKPCKGERSIQEGTAGTPERDAAETGLTVEEVDHAVASAKNKLLLNPDLHDSIHTLAERALLSERARANELQASLDLRWKADMRAIERWRAAGKGRELTLPDQADLCLWLLEQREVCLQWARSVAYRTEGGTSAVERAVNAEAHSLLRAQRFCPHFNPCDHNGGEKCRAPSTPSADAPTREAFEEECRRVSNLLRERDLTIAEFHAMQWHIADLFDLLQARASCAPSQVPRERLCNNQRESAYAFSAWLASEYEDISLDDDDTVRQQMEHAWREAMKVANNEVTE